MDPIAIVALAISAFFLGSFAMGVLVVVVAIRREDREFSLSRGKPDHLSRAVRRLSGLGVRASGERRGRS